MCFFNHACQGTERERSFKMHRFLKYFAILLGIYRFIAITSAMTAGLFLANSPAQASSENGLHWQSDLFCEGWVASMPGLSIWLHVFAEPQIVLVELAGTHQRQTVIVNAEPYIVEREVRNSDQMTELFRMKFDGGSLQLPSIPEHQQTSAAILTLKGRAAKDLESGITGPFRVLVQCHSLPEQEPYHD